MKLGLLKDQYLVSIIAISGVAALCFPFTDWIGYRSVALLLLLTVSILAMRLSLYPVLLAATMILTKKECFNDYSIPLPNTLPY